MSHLRIMNHTDGRLRPCESENARKKTVTYNGRRRPYDRESFFREEPDVYEISDYDAKNDPASELIEKKARQYEETVKKHFPNGYVYKPKPNLPSKNNKTTRKIFPVQKLSKQLFQSSFKKKKKKKNKDKIETYIYPRDYAITVYTWNLPREGFDRVSIEGSESGGYGAIIRDHGGRTRVAAAGVSKPVSLLYHQLEGVKRGLMLAKDCGCRQLDVSTTSYFVVLAVSKMWKPSGQNDLPVVHDILGEIWNLKSEFKKCYLHWIPGLVNRAAGYLSKVYKEVVFDRNGLPMELADIVWDDASGAEYHRV